jgi:DCN1-like protein 1/2
MRIGKGEDKIDSDGLQTLFADVKVDPLDPVTLVFSMVCKAKTMVINFTLIIYRDTIPKKNFSLDWFQLGMTLNSLKISRADNIKDLENAFKNLRKKLTDENDFKEVYRYTFNFAKDSEKARNLNVDLAKGILLLQKLTSSLVGNPS